VQLIALAGHATGPILRAGEVLIALGSPVVGRISTLSTGASAQFQLPVPNDPMLAGLTVYAQSLLVGGGSAVLCNAIDATAGN
jgi:hypothetical protein